jgi:hypothetical protein
MWSITPLHAVRRGEKIVLDPELIAHLPDYFPEPEPMTAVTDISAQVIDPGALQRLSNRLQPRGPVSVAPPRIERRRSTELERAISRD